MPFLGGQRRTYICPCGWGTKDSVRASDMKMKMHMKKCNAVHNLNAPAFNPDMNGLNGIQINRRGNLQHNPLNAVINFNGGVWNEVPLAVAMEAKEMIADIRIVEEKKA